MKPSDVFDGPLKRPARNGPTHERRCLLPTRQVLSRDPTIYLARIPIFVVMTAFFAVLYWNARQAQQQQVAAVPVATLRCPRDDDARHSRAPLLTMRRRVPPHLAHLDAAPPRAHAAPSCLPRQVMPKVFFTMMIIEFPGMFSLVVCYSLNFELKAVKREVKDGMYSPATYWLVFTLIQIPMIFRNRRPFRTHLAPLLPRHGVVERPEILCALRHERRHILVLPPPSPRPRDRVAQCSPSAISSLIFPYLPLFGICFPYLAQCSPSAISSPRSTR